MSSTQFLGCLTIYSWQSALLCAHTHSWTCSIVVTWFSRLFIFICRWQIAPREPNDYGNKTKITQQFVKQLVSTNSKKSPLELVLHEFTGQPGWWVKEQGWSPCLVHLSQHTYAWRSGKFSGWGTQSSGTNIRHFAFNIPKFRMRRAVHRGHSEEGRTPHI